MTEKEVDAAAEVKPEETPAAGTDTDMAASANEASAETPAKKTAGKEERELEQKMVKVIKKMPDSVQSRFQMLHVLSDKRSKINDEFEAKVKVINEQFETKKKPLLELRDKIVNGELLEFAEYLPKYDQYKAKLEDFMTGVVKDENDEEETDKPEKEKVDYSVLKTEKGIPDFWKTIIRNNPMTKQLIQKHDEDILDKLIGLTAAHTLEDDLSKISVELVFDTNDFFENASLTYTVISPEGEEDEVKEVIGCEINWKADMNVTKKKIKKTQKNKKTNEKRVVNKTVPQDSMFNIFESKKAPEELDGEDSEEERVMQGLQEAFDFANDVHDMYMGEAIEHYLCPDNSLDALMGQFGGGGSSDDDDEEADGGEDKADKKSAKSKKSKKDAETPAGASAGGKSGEEKKEECQQQ